MLILIEEFIASITENDLIVFFYSGHGKKLDQDNDLIPTDNECLAKYPVIHSQHSISVNRTINRTMKRKPFVIIFLLDCCRIPIQIRQGAEAIMLSGYSRMG